jgi:hypothetical protein
MRGAYKPWRRGKRSIVVFLNGVRHYLRLVARPFSSNLPTVAPAVDALNAMVDDIRRERYHPRSSGYSIPAASLYGVLSAPGRRSARDLAEEVLDSLRKLESGSVDDQHWQSLNDGVEENPLTVSIVCKFIDGFAVRSPAFQTHEVLDER